jgi:protein SCO1/2
MVKPAHVLALTLLLPLLGLIGFGLARQRAADAPAVLWPVPDFQLLDQDSTPFSSEQLRGRVWLASFVYTNCPDVCPMVTQRMAALRDSLQSEGMLDDVGLLSFSVDPTRDSPTVLRAYAAQFRARQPDWMFLTGSLDTVIPLVTRGFRLTAMHPAHGANASEHSHDNAGAADYIVTHTDRIVLIDREGQVRGTYESSDAAALSRLHRDLKRILQ